MVDLINIYFAVFLPPIFTSFFFCWGHRTETGVSIVTETNSRCDNCNIKLNWIAITPVLGTLIYRGKCHSCKKKYPLHSFYLEMLSVVISVNTLSLTDSLIITLVVNSLFMVMVFITAKTTTRKSQKQGEIM